MITTKGMKGKYKMICKDGVSECTGCMCCENEQKNFECPFCGKECDTLYKDRCGEIFACDRCVKAVDLYLYK